MAVLIVFCSFKVKTMAKKAITITADKQVINDAKKRAEYEHRSFSNHIEWLLIKDIREGEINNKINPTELD